ncbi:hypothetical protein ACFVS2_20800 [Brevibacillus sp. NPDC058079]|uniref:hypothetical protein n=1 Tax=Brevibacillus sp. NPDC058079 TaxID=3346330 RepID=UPI0036E6EA7E
MRRSLWRGTFTIKIQFLKEEDRFNPVFHVSNAEKEEATIHFEGSLKGAILYVLKTYRECFAVSANFYDSNRNWLKEISF